MIRIQDELTRRAHKWPLDRRLRKAQEEMGECVAAINRYLENPTDSRRLLLAEELVGVTVTLLNVEPEFHDACQSVLNRQLSRLADALDREGL